MSVDYAAALHLAVRALWRNKTRAFLTALGVIIGVGSVIAMVSVGAGAQKKVADQVASLGTNSFVIRAGAMAYGGVRSGAAKTLTLIDADAISEMPGVTAVSPSVRTNVQIRYRGTNWPAPVEGVTPAFFKLRNWQLEEGELFTERQVASAAHVCILGQTTARELFGLSNAIGESILIKNIVCRVIGILVAKGASAFGTDQDDTVIMPLTTVQRKLMGITNLDSIEVDTLGGETVDQLVKAVEPLLKKLHRIQEGQPLDFNVRNRAELVQTAKDSAMVFTWLLGSIAFVSLLVGGIGVMNIMLVSVTERTREIGIRMALGARRRDVLWQFMLEALMLSVAGGILGVVLGLGSAYAITVSGGLPVTITTWAVLLAFSFSVLIGLFFGIYPARKASRFQPIQALRYE